MSRHLETRPAARAIATLRTAARRLAGRFRCKVGDHDERSFRSGGIEHAFCLRSTCPTRGTYLRRVPVWENPDPWAQPRFIWNGEHFIANPDHPETHGLRRFDRAPQGEPR